MCLTGRMMDAAEAERSGLVSRVVPAEDLMEETMKVAERIADMSAPIAMMAKEAVNRAYETTLAEGVRFERRLFHSTFGTEDQKEGMAAFVEKRQPDFKTAEQGYIEGRDSVIDGDGARLYNLRLVCRTAPCGDARSGSFRWATRYGARNKRSKVGTWRTISPQKSVSVATDATKKSTTHGSCGSARS